MIRNQWYAVLASKDIKKDKAAFAERFGERLLFFRDSEGAVVCLKDKCAHRGASLSGGSARGKFALKGTFPSGGSATGGPLKCTSLSGGFVKDGIIRCPFHGIEYDGSGKCVHIPSEGRASKQDFRRFNLKSYPVREIGDIIFVWYGDGPCVGEPDYFDIIEEPSFSYDQMDDIWHVHYSRVIENQLDVSHLAFVHHNTIGRGNKTLCNGPKVIWLDDNTLRTSADNAPDTGQLPKPAEESTIKSTNLTFKFPNMWLNHISDKLMILAFFIPVNEETSIISLRFYNKFTGIAPIDRFIAKTGSFMNKIIERQDKRVVETQLPKASTLYMKENLVSADFPIIEYRRRRGELIRESENEN